MLLVVQQLLLTFLVAIHPVGEMAAAGRELPARRVTCTAQWMPSFTGSPGWRSFTAKVSSNACGRSVRAYTFCSYFPNGSSYSYGAFIVTGSSKAECALAGSAGTPYGIRAT